MILNVEEPLRTKDSWVIAVKGLNIIYSQTAMSFSDNIILKSTHSQYIHVVGDFIHTTVGWEAFVVSQFW